MDAKMTLLKNQEEFNTWKKNNIYPEDTADEPREFPCWVYTVVQSWRHEEECAVYLYRNDLENMLAAMAPNV